LQVEKPHLVYTDILAEVYRRILKAEGIEIDDAAEKAATEFGESVGSWPAFADTVKAMQRLGKHYQYFA